MFRRMDVLVTLMDDAALEPVYTEVTQLPTEIALSLLETEGNKVVDLTTRFKPTLESFLDMCLEELSGNSHEKQMNLLYFLSQGTTWPEELESFPLLGALNNLGIFWKNSKITHGYWFGDVSSQEPSASYSFIAKHAFFQFIRETSFLDSINTRRKIEPSLIFFSNVFLVAEHVDKDADKDTWDGWFGVWRWLNNIVQTRQVPADEDYSWLEPWK